MMGVFKSTDDMRARLPDHKYFYIKMDEASDLYLIVFGSPGETTDQWQIINICTLDEAQRAVDNLIKCTTNILVDDIMIFQSENPYMQYLNGQQVRILEIVQANIRFHLLSEPISEQKFGMVTEFVKLPTALTNPETEYFRNFSS